MRMPRALAHAFVTSVALCAGVAAQDTLVVRADGPPAWGTDLRLVEEVRIGALEGDERDTFGRVVGVVPVADGSVFVADGQTQVVRRYAADGTHLADVGGPGEGPGEFKGITGAQPYRGDSVAVWDGYAWRVSIFAPDGALGRTFAGGFPGSIVGAPRPFVTTHDGGFWTLGVDAAGLVPEARGETPWIWLRADADGTVLDTVPQAARAPDGPYVGGPPYGFGTFAAFGVHTMTAVSPAGYMVRARNDRYAFHRPLGDGRIVRVERSWTPVPVHPDERDQFRASAEHMVALWRDRYDFSADVPDTKPPFWAVWVDSEARVWMAPHVEAHHRPETDADRAERQRLGELRGSVPPPMEWWEPPTVDVFEPNGRFLGTVVLPSAASMPMAARGRTLWTVEKGDFDESYVVRYRIEPGR